MKLWKTMILSVALVCLSGVAGASVNFSQNGDEITMTVVDETYTLSVDQSENILYVAYLDVFLPGGGSANDSDRVSGSATMSVNGGPPVTLSWWTGWQYRPGFQSPWTPEDVSFLFSLSPLTLLAGDVITINGTLTMDMTGDPDIILPEATGIVPTAIGGHNLYYSQIGRTPLTIGDDVTTNAMVTEPVPAVGLPGVLGGIVLFLLLGGWILVRREV